MVILENKTEFSYFIHSDHINEIRVIATFSSSTGVAVFGSHKFGTLAFHASMYLHLYDLTPFGRDTAPRGAKFGTRRRCVVGYRVSV